MTQRLLAAGLLAGLIAAAPVPARANSDIIHLLSDIHVTPDTPVHDAICFFCSIRNDGTISGDTVVFFGSVHISGTSERDVVGILSTVRVNENASIGGDLVTIFGNVRLGENASVGRDTVSVFGSIRAPASVRVGGQRVAIPAIVFWGPILLFILIIVLIVNAVRSRKRRWPMAGYPPPPVDPGPRQ